MKLNQPVPTTLAPTYKFLSTSTQIIHRYSRTLSLPFLRPDLPRVCTPPTTRPLECSAPEFDRLRVSSARAHFSVTLGISRKQRDASMMYSCQLFSGPGPNKRVQSHILSTRIASQNNHRDLLLMRVCMRSRGYLVLAIGMCSLAYPWSGHLIILTSDRAAVI